MDSAHVYWTNSGCLDSIGRPRKEGGTIGRADIDGSEASVEPEFITGASDPQGIAVNATHIYWANKEGPACGRPGDDRRRRSSTRPSITPGATRGYRSGWR